MSTVSTWWSWGRSSVDLIKTGRCRTPVFSVTTSLTGLVLYEERQRESSQVPDRLLMCSIIMLLYLMWFEGQQAPPVLFQLVSMCTCAVQHTRSPHEPLWQYSSVLLTLKSSGEHLLWRDSWSDRLFFCICDWSSHHQEVQRGLPKSGYHSPRDFVFDFFLYDVDMIDAEILLNDFNCCDTSPLITVQSEYALTWTKESWAKASVLMWTNTRPTIIVTIDKK